MGLTRLADALFEELKAASDGDELWAAEQIRIWLALKLSQNGRS